MSHPTPLLADYVDGALDPPTRAEVDRHLRTCAMCRGEIALSRAGARAAQGMGEPVAPEGLGDVAIAEAARMAAERNPEVTSIAGRSRRRPTTSRVLAAAGAAAAVLLLVVIAPKLGQGSGQDLAANAGAGAAQPPTAYPTATGVEIQHADYTFDALPQVVEQLQTTLAPKGQGSVAAGASQPMAGPVEGTAVPSLQSDAATDPSLLPKATACLNQAFSNPSGTLSRVILARYQGQPAYLGVYLIGPGAELPPTILQLNIASVHGCRVLDQTAARL
jgi:hypothetical protein